MLPRQPPANVERLAAWVKETVELGEQEMPLLDAPAAAQREHQCLQAEKEEARNRQGIVRPLRPSRNIYSVTSHITPGAGLTELLIRLFSYAAHAVSSPSDIVHTPFTHAPFATSLTFREEDSLSPRTVDYSTATNK